MDVKLLGKPKLNQEYLYKMGLEMTSLKKQKLSESSDSDIKLERIN